MNSRADEIRDVTEALARLHSADVRRIPLGLTAVQAHELAEHLDAYEAENQRLRKERDHYRRRWIVRGIKWRRRSDLREALAGDAE